MKTAASVMEAADLLCTDVDCILGGDLMAVCDAVCSMECKGSYGTILFDHLAADGAGLTGGQVTVVTVLQVDAHFLCSLHLELLHSSLSLGNIDLVIALHNDLSPFSGFDGFIRRKHSFAEFERITLVSFRKYRQKPEAAANSHGSA